MYLLVNGASAVLETMTGQDAGAWKSSKGLLKIGIGEKMDKNLAGKV